MLIKNHMNKEWKTIAAFFIGTLIGTGSLWQYWSLKNDDMRLEIDRNNQIIQLYSKVTELFDQYLKFRDQYTTVALQVVDNSDPRASDNQKEKIEVISLRIRVIREEIINFENRIANIEGRKPRKLFKGLRPLAPFVPEHQILKVIVNDNGEIIYSDKLIYSPAP